MAFAVSGANSFDDTAAQVSKDAGLISWHDFLTH